MTTPIWEPGTIYLPGELVRPRSADSVPWPALANSGFDLGNLSNWTTVQTEGGTPSASTGRPFAGTHSGQWLGANGTSDGGGTACVFLHNQQGPVVPGQSVTVSAYIAMDDTGSSANFGRARVYWFKADNSPCTPAFVNSDTVVAGNYSHYVQSSVTAQAPADAAYARAAAWVSANTSGAMRVDSVTWSSSAPPASSFLLYKAVQAAAGTSGSTEPAWPATLGLTVVDNTVTWEAVSIARIVWQAQPAMVSGGVEPTWGTAVGARVADNQVSWEAISRRIEDEKCPHSKVVVIAASKVYAADDDVVRYCATVNPLDWSTASDAGYLPYGLQQYGANPIAAMGLYRSNLVVFNAQAFQMWQVDEDPANSALLDALPIGSTHHKALAPVSNDLFFNSAQGVRTVSIAGGSTNLAAGDVGMPIDPLVQDAIGVASANTSKALSTYYPSAGQYWLAFSDYPPPPLSLSGNHPDGITGETMAATQYVAAGGIRPYSSYTITAGSLPPGRTLNASTGQVTGTPTTGGSYSWTVQVMDADGAVATVADTALITGVYGWVAQQENSLNYARSLSGTNWQEESNRSHTGFSNSIVSAFAGRFITGSGIVASNAVSTDGAITWAAYSQMPLGSSAGGKIVFADGWYISARGNPSTVGIARTQDLAGSWTTVTVASLNANPANAFAARVGMAIVGDNGGKASRSIDNGATWSVAVQALPASTAILGVATDGTRFVLVGNGHNMRRTDDGITYTAITSPFTTTGGTSAQNIIGAVAYGNGKWVAGVDSAFGGTPGQMAYSTDGVTWTLGTGGLGAGCVCIGYAGGLFVAVGRTGKIATSTDGITWTQRANNFGTNTISSVTALLGNPLA